MFSGPLSSVSPALSSFFVLPPEDRLPPSITVNKGLVLNENSAKKLTTLQLSASDQDSEPGELIFRVTKQPSLGHLEHAASPGNANTLSFQGSTSYVGLMSEMGSNMAS